MTIGVLGGTFNPIHVGHLILAQEMGIQLGFSKILFVPAKIPPHKPNTISEWHRFQMVQLAIGDNPYFEISRVEIDRPEVSYTLHTIQLLQKSVPEPLAFIIGSDNILDLPHWHQWQKLVELCELVVGERPNFGLETLAKMENILGKSLCGRLRQNFVPIPTINVSSSEIRKRYAAKKSNRYVVPDKVDQYILAHRLYTDPSSIDDLPS